MKAATDLVVIGVAYALQALATFATSIAVGRTLGAAALGTFSLTTTVARLFYATSDFGLVAHLTRSLARDRSRSVDLLGLFFAFRAALIPLAMVVTTVIVAVMDDQGGIIDSSLFAVAAGIAMIQNLCEGVLLSHDDQSSVSLLTVFSSTFLVGSIGVWAFAKGSLLALAGVSAVAGTVALAAWLAACRRRMGGPPRLHLDLAALRKELRHSWPIGASMLLGLGALKCPIVVLGAFSTPADVGAFSAADMFITASAIMQAVISAVTYPKLAASFAVAPEQFRRLFLLSNAALVILGMLAAAVLTQFGAQIAAIAFPGKDFGAIAHIMPIVGWSAPAVLLVHHNILVFAASGRERLNLILMVGWFAAITVCQLAIVPYLGLIGSAWASLIGRSLGLAMLIGATAATGLSRGARRR